MDRISNTLLSNNFLQDLHRQQAGMAQTEKQLSTHTKNILPEDDPVAVSQYMFQKSRLNDISRFDNNATMAKSRLDLTEASLNGVSDLLLRAKELAVQGANGVHTASERHDMGIEVNQILEQTISLSNTQYNGMSLFGGSNGEARAFNIERGSVVNPANGRVTSKEPSVLKVHYQGDNTNHFAELGHGEYLKTNLSGSEAFFASNQVIVGGTPGSGYIAPKDQDIRIDGTTINIKMGDNIEAVKQKINDAKLSVTASVDNSNGKNLLTLESTVPHQIYLEDMGGGSVLQDLGMISSSKASPPNNYSPAASVIEGSIFDKLIELRDGLYNDDTNQINRSLGGVDESIQATLDNIAKVGANQHRVDKTTDRLSQQKLYTSGVIAKLNDLDVADSIVQLKNWETELQTSLQIGSKLLPKTLLDYLR